MASNIINLDNLSVVVEVDHEQFEASFYVLYEHEDGEFLFDLEDNMAKFVCFTRYPNTAKAKVWYYKNSLPEHIMSTLEAITEAMPELMWRINEMILDAANEKIGEINNLKWAVKKAAVAAQFK